MCLPFIEKTPCLVIMESQPFRIIFHAAVLVSFIFCISGCSTIQKAVVNPAGEKYPIHVIINDRFVEEAKQESDKENRMFMVARLREELSKSFRSVEVSSSADRTPMPQELYLVPHRVEIRTGWLDSQGAARNEEDGEKGKVHPFDEHRAEADAEISIINQTENTEYSLTAKGGKTLLFPDKFIAAPVNALIRGLVFTSYTLTFNQSEKYFNGVLFNGAARDSLSSIAADLHNRYLASDKFREFAELTRIDNSLPCALTLKDPSPRFSDRDALLPNNALDAGEKAELLIAVKNTGKGTAFNPTLELTSDSHDILLERSVMVGTIGPDGKKEVRVSLEAGLDIQDGRADIQVLVKEKRGLDVKKAVVSVPTARLRKPRLEIVSAEINDGNTGLAGGNGNGIIESGETVEITAFIRNTGEGSALGVSLLGEGITSGVQWERSSSQAGAIRTGETIKAKLAFTVPRSFKASAIEPALKVTDVRGVGGVERKYSFGYEKRSPSIRYACRVYSRGKQVQRLTNGESYEIELDASNTGRLLAKEVSMSLSGTGQVSLSEPGVSFGDIGENSYKTSRRIGLTIPRIYGEPQVRLGITVSQADYEPLSDSIVIPVEIKAPKLSYRANLRSRSGFDFLGQGESGVLEINVVNEGNLASEGVKVGIECRDEYLDIVGAREFLIGTIPPNATSETVKFQLSSRSGISTGSKNLRVTISQEDFSTVDSKHVLNVRQGWPMVIGAAVAESAVRAATGPSIGLQASQGTVSTESDRYFLRFDVRDEKKVETLSVMLNGRIVPLGGTELEGLKTGRVEVMKSIPLKVGANDIVVTASNSDYQYSTATMKVTRKGDIDVDSPPFTTMSNPGAWAVVVGISQYENSQVMPPVDYAVNDARTMKQYLVKTLGFDSGKVVEFYDANARCTKLKSQFNKLRKNIEPGKTDVFIYYSGHGISDPNTQEAYFAPYDFDPETIAETGYSLKDFNAMIAGLRARSVTVVIDACFSGSAGDGRMLIQKASPGMLIVNNPLQAGSNSVFFCSSESRQISNWYPEKKHGLFTYYFLSGLQGRADADKDGLVTVKEMEKYLSANVPRQARTLFNRNQTPECRGDKSAVIAAFK